MPDIPAYARRDLERLFQAEMSVRLYQPHNGRCTRAMQWLVDHGMAEPAEMGLSGTKDFPWPVTIKGYRITMAGHLNYCMNCGDEDE